MNYILILTRINHFGIHMNITNCGWFLHMLELPLIVKEFTWMRASNSYWSIQKLCVALGSRLTGVRWLPLHPLVNCEYFTSPFISGISQACLLVPLSVTHRRIQTLTFFWSNDLKYCDIFFVESSL